MINILILPIKPTKKTTNHNKLFQTSSVQLIKLSLQVVHEIWFYFDVQIGIVCTGSYRSLSHAPTHFN